jgi:hypothetical protein
VLINTITVTKERRMQVRVKIDNFKIKKLLNGRRYIDDSLNSVIILTTDNESFYLNRRQHELIDCGDFYLVKNVSIADGHVDSYLKVSTCFSLVGKGGYCTDLDKAMQQEFKQNVGERLNHLKGMFAPSKKNPDVVQLSEFARVDYPVELIRDAKGQHWLYTSKKLPIEESKE